MKKVLDVEKSDIRAALEEAEVRSRPEGGRRVPASPAAC